jgi:hypothetical protein
MKKVRNPRINSLEKPPEIIYDVSVYLTCTPHDTRDEILNGPLSGGLCSTYKILNNLANKCSGDWKELEPHRCTFFFPSKEKSDEFIKRIMSDLGLWQKLKSS